MVVVIRRIKRQRFKRPGMSSKSFSEECGGSKTCTNVSAGRAEPSWQYAVGSDGNPSAVTALDFCFSAWQGLPAYGGQGYGQVTNKGSLHEELVSTSVFFRLWAKKAKVELKPDLPIPRQVLPAYCLAARIPGPVTRPAVPPLQADGATAFRAPIHPATNKHRTA